MQEKSVAQLVSTKTYKNITDLLVLRAQESPNHTAFEVIDESEAEDTWREISTAEFLQDVQKTAKLLISVGMKPGQSVAIMSPTSYEWAVADLAIWFAGGVVVPIYETSSRAQLETIFQDAKVRFGFAGNDTLLNLLSDSMTAVFETSGTFINLKELSKLKVQSHVSDEELEARRNLARREDPATIVYTSGTSGSPKGVILTHDNFLSQILNIAAAYKDVVHPAGNTIIFLPLAHVLARGLQLICIASGMRIAHLSDTKKVIATFERIRPTFVVVVPRVLQKIQLAISEKARSAKIFWLWKEAVRTAESYGSNLENLDFSMIDSIPTRIKLKRFIFDKIFFKRIRKVLGGRTEYILSGGASLGKDMSLFFRGVGIPVIEGYGLTETTAPLTGNLPGKIKSGTVGQPLPGMTVRISDKGEVLAKGSGVSPGYKSDELSRSAFENGFFRTGDLGFLDSDGYLTLTGRISDTIVTSTGKTVVPALWENEVSADPLISYVAVAGEASPYLVAVIVIDSEAEVSWSKKLGRGIRIRENAGFKTVFDESVLAHIQKVVDSANLLVARSEQVRKFTVILEDISDPKLITPTMKIRRRAFFSHFSLVIANMYKQEKRR